MTKSSADAFLERLEADPVLRSKWQDKLQEALQSAMVVAAAGDGFHFTPEELGRALAEREQALSESELAQVAGGLNPQPEPPAPVMDLQRLLDFLRTLPNPAPPSPELRRF